MTTPRSLSCPRCSHALSSAERRGVVIAPCFECGGLWLSANASETINAALNDEAGDAARAAGVTAATPTPERQTGGASLPCPECAQTMQRWPVGPVEVDQCAEHGTWYDRGELQDVQAILFERYGQPVHAELVDDDANRPRALRPDEDSGLELAREPTRGEKRAKIMASGVGLRMSHRHIVQGMIAAQIARERHDERWYGENPDAWSKMDNDDGWLF